MSVSGRSAFDIGALLESTGSVAPVEAVDTVAEAIRAAVGARRVTFWIADFSGRSVVRLTSVDAVAPRHRPHGGDAAEAVRLDGTVYDRVLRSQQADVRAAGDAGARLVVPVTDRGDAIGLVEVEFDRVPTEQETATVGTAAHALAYVVIAARRYTDVFEWGQRTTPFSLAAEIQRRLLPASYTCEAAQFALAGWLEPASTVGGDTFDYTLDRDTLQLSITDAVGHHVAAALLATLLVGGLRNARRRGLDLAAQARYANDAVFENGQEGQFVTGQLVRVDLATASAVIVNAGHPWPLRLREGRVQEVALAVDPPFGVRPGQAHRLQPLPLQPGDRFVFLTDGVQERNAASLDVARALADTRELHPREVVHELGTAVLRATGGDLRDDATVVCLDWHGGPDGPRDSRRGADQAIASPARHLADAAGDAGRG